MSITEQIYGIIYRNPGVKLNDILENCINQEYAEVLLNDLVDNVRVECVHNCGELTYCINETH